MALKPTLDGVLSESGGSVDGNTKVASGDLM